MITQSRLKELVCYENGVFIAIKRSSPLSRTKIGAELGHVNNKTGYMSVTIDKHRVYIHRLVWLYHHGNIPEFIDHIDHDKTNNRLNNLRAVTHSENQKNRPRQCNNSSGHNGVYWCDHIKKWEAKIKINGRYKNLGYYIEKNEAIKARKNGDIKYNFHKNHGGEY